MSSNISINSATQQIAASSGSPVKRSEHADDKFAGHLADAAVKEKTNGGPDEGGEPIVDSELSAEDSLLTEAKAQKAEVPKAGVPEVESGEINLDDLEISTKSSDVEQADLKPVATKVVPSADVAASVKEAAVSAAAVSAEAAKNSGVGKTQGEAASVKSVVATNVSNIAGRRESSRAAQGKVETGDLSVGDADAPSETVKQSRTMERPLVRTVGRGRANGVVEGEKGTVTGLTPNNNGAVKAERPVNAASQAFGRRGAESRLASMMEASGSFDGDVKITVGKQENHMLPVMPQQLSVTGMSRTVVSQVLELRRSGELEAMGLDVKTTANKPVKIIEVQLMPRNLGMVGITIRNVAGRISISIEVQGAEAERLIKNEVDKIAGAIRQAGQIVEDISIKRGVQMSQQTDSLSDDRGRHEGANFGRNSDNLMGQSSRGETDETSDRQRFGEIGIQESGKIASSSDKSTRQGIYL